MEVHFIGIGGIGMSALALLSLQRGYKVSGSDVKESYLTKQLEEKGAKIFYSHHPKNIDKTIAVVVSSAISSDNQELRSAEKLGCKIYHRSEFLAFFMKEKKQIMVSGAHGKTTTTALLTHIFSLAGKNPSYAIGGMLIDKPHANLDEGEYFIFEGDESDGSFLKAEPEAAIFTNIDREHMNYWGNFENLLEGFKKAINLIKDPKKLICCSDDYYISSMNLNCVFYGLNNSKLTAKNIKYTSHGMEFSILDGSYEIPINLKLFGKHNVLNALACYGVAKSYEINNEIIQKAFSTFTGVKRRFEVIGRLGNTTFIDDYAHHPVEISAIIEVLKKISTVEKILVIFQPHRFGRFSDLLEDFLKVLSEPLDLAVLPVYSAFENPVQNLLENFLQKVKTKKTFFLEKKDVNDFLQSNFDRYELIITLGAGDVTSVNREFIGKNTR